MSRLFLFSIFDIFSQIPLDIVVLFANIIILIFSIICLVCIVMKVDYGIKKRFWIVFVMLGVSLIQVWLELLICKEIKNVILTIGISLCLLALLLFLPKKQREITQPQRDLVRLLSNTAKGLEQVGYADTTLEKSNVFSSPIIKAQPRTINTADEEAKKSEIDFSHVKNVLNKLEYYPLKEQDKKQTKELENAIITAEQNGINHGLKEKINDGLGALLKIMSKYAI